MEPPVCRTCGYDFRAAAEPEYTADGYNGDAQGMNQSAGQQPYPGQEQNAGMQPNPQAGQYAAHGGNYVQPGAGTNPQQNYQQGNYNFNNQTPQPVQNVKPAEKKKKKFWIPLVIAGVFVVILLILCGPVLSVVKTLVAISKLNNKPSSTVVASSPKTSLPSSSGIDDSELLGESVMIKRHYGRHDFEEVDLAFYEGMADISTTTSSGGFDPFINPYVTTYRDSSSVFDNTHTNYYGTTMGPDYYEPFCDCIDSISYASSYQIARKYYYYDDQMGNIRVRANIAFAELSGNIPNLDALNQEIYERTASDLFNYLNGSSPYSMYVYETITFSVDSYIVYNDADKVSILTDCVVHTDDYWMNLDSYIYAINVDLKNGKIIENDEILNIDKDFAAKYRAQCLTQNGSNSAWDPIEDDELAEYLSDRETNIVFYNPIGLEIGAAYTYQDDILSRGWATVTLKDGTYDDLLKDPSLRKSGGRSIYKTAPTGGGWVSVNPLEAYHESEELRENFPDYNWLTEDDIQDWNLPDGENGKGTSINPEEDSEEEEDEDTDTEEDSEDTSEDDDDTGNVYDIPDISSYEELMEWYEQYGTKTEDGIRTMTADEYFRLPRKEPENK